MVMIKHQIEEYEKKNGHLPDTIEGFRRFNKNRDITKDEWGNQIIYTVDSEGFITLTSLGRDGKPGGKGKNSDTILHFKTGDSIVMPFNSEHKN